ncbi:MAG TPA: hypothetical protein VMM76_19335 [Pirellulaceae bacterium]|nr:hypothetical protein [Pirellulaceae bacterium]
MRLTLRTMLAYLDDVLDPADARELEHKIEESSFASGLVHRVRDSIRRLRLGAPKLDGRGLGLDPNTVADYLDSTLAPERVPEFEKVCLESDVHLAEVASCHQILTLVLGEPAQVDAALRERVYRIGHADNRRPKAAANASGNGAALAATRSGADASSAGASTAVSPVKSQRPSQLSIKSLAITVLLCFVVAMIALQAVGVDKLRGLIGLSSPRKIGLSSPREAAERPLPAEPEAGEPEITIPSDAEQSSLGSRESDRLPPPDETASSEISTDAAFPVPAGESLVDLRPVPASEIESTVSAGPEVMTDPVESAVASPAVEVNEVPPHGEVASPVEGAAGQIAAKGTVSAGAAEVAVDPAAEPARQISVGRYINEEQVLARFDTAAGDWFRMEPHAPLLTGQRIISLPTYRPQLLLSPNIKVTLAGESHLQFGQSKEEAAPLLKIESGRAIIAPLGEPEAAIYVETAGRSGSVLFASADSVMAVDVMKYLPPGQRPELEPATPIIQLFALSGQLAWREVGQEEFVVSAGQVLTMEGEGAPALFESSELPAWVAGNDLADIDRVASTELREDLATDRPLSLSLLERTEHRRVEVRSLARRSLCSLDMFDAAINALDGPGFRSYWFAQFDAIRGAMGRNSESAIKLQRSLEKLTGDDAGLMYELFCGFNADQLAAGGAKQLVDALEHERLITRVLAYENLRRITDKTQQFRPEQPPSQQKGEVVKWRRNLAAGAIVYLRPKLALPPRRAVTEGTGGDPSASE